jgi:perosamine synthetase|tara:strand:+ start:2037 stop:3143 length:1107 start_codon:yes stop_codon:yes gene_type:complete
MKKLIPLYKPYISNDEKKNVLKCLKDNWISSKGKFIKKFEDSFKKKFGYKYSCVTTNGTTALHLSLLALDIKIKDEVIVPNLTYVAPANAVKYVGANAVLADINPETWLMDVKEIEKKITRNTKAIILVHLYGFVYNFSEIKKLRKKYNIKIIEDCAEAIGSKFRNKFVGNFGDISTFSFYGNKTFTTGEGGMVVTKKKSIFEKIVKFKSQGLNIYKKNNYYNHEIVGYNYRMTNICAAIGYSQLKKVNFFISQKKKINDLYQKFLSSDQITFQQALTSCKSTFWLVNILFKDSLTKLKVERYLKNKNIETRPIFKPMNQLKMFKLSDKNFTNSISISSRGISLPSYPDLKTRDIKYISDNIKSCLKK